MNGNNARSEPAVSMDLGGYGTPPLRELRQLLRSALHHEDTECVTDAELVMTELVSNAYDHGGKPRYLHVWTQGNPTTVRIEVDDTRRENLPVVGKSRLRRLRGRGLVVVDRLSRKWGVSLHRVGKTVWAELSCRLSRPELALVP